MERNKPVHPPRTAVDGTTAPAEAALVSRRRLRRTAVSPLTEVCKGFSEGRLESANNGFGLTWDTGNTGAQIPSRFTLNRGEAPGAMLLNTAP